MSKIIVIEGPDRCGKATQSALLCEYLWQCGKKAKVVEVPIHDKITYDAIYWMLEKGHAKKFPRVFQLTQFLNRWLFQTKELSDLDHEYDYLIFDRWSLSTTVYGKASGVDDGFVNYFYKKLRKPDFTLVLLGKPHSHVAEDVYEKDNELQEKVRKLYADWVNKHPREAHVVASDRSKESVFTEIIVVLKTTRSIPS
jgi:thymidylate kinase